MGDNISTTVMSSASVRLVSEANGEMQEHHVGGFISSWMKEPYYAVRVLSEPPIFGNSLFECNGDFNVGSKFASWFSWEYSDCSHNYLPTERG